MADAKKDVLQPLDDEARAIARRLMRSARHGALASTRAEDGWPISSRVALATEPAGNPLILISSLSAHSAALRSSSRCSLLVGEPGKGDPLAHPRMTLFCEAVEFERGTAAHDTARRRYLNRHPKAGLYVDFADFAFFRLAPAEASLNGGFARAYRLAATDLLDDVTLASALEASEQAAIDHMNEDHLDAIDIFARYYAGRPSGRWRLTGIDVRGMDLSAGDDAPRVDFLHSLAVPEDLRPMLVQMAKAGRAALAGQTD